VRLAATMFFLAMTLPARADPPFRAGSANGDDAKPQSVSLDTEQMDGACSYTTSMFARRILHEGSDWSFTGHLREAAKLDNHVGAPFVVGDDEGTRVVATELLQHIEERDLTNARLTLTGKRLKLGDTEYFVLTDASPADTAH
jgi:hypothetical protein